MTPYMIICIGAVVSALCGAWLGARLGRRAARPSNSVDQRALAFLREADQLRTVVLAFVGRARLEHPPTDEDWRALVDAMLHPGTPKRIRESHHRIAELPKHLDDLYVSKKDMKAAVDAIDAALADLTIRVMDVQVTVALAHAHVGIFDGTDHDWWMFVGGIRDSYIRRVRRHVGNRLAEIQHLGDDLDSVMVSRMATFLGVDGARTDADRDGG